MAFSGDLEVHLTVSGCDPTRRVLLPASALGFKYLCIVLSRGDSPEQPMLTRHVRGDLSSAQAVATNTANRLAADGFLVTRTKIEVSPWCAGVPLPDGDAVPGRYFECHVKLLLPPGANTDALTAVAVRHDAHVSRNAVKVRGDGHAERFVTQRGFGIGRGAAKARFDALLAGLAPLGYPVLDAEEEYVVQDSNLSLDRGWMP